MRRRRGICYEAEVEEQGERPRFLRRHGTQDQHCRPRLLHRGGHRVRRPHGHSRLVRFLGEDRVSLTHVLATHPCRVVLEPASEQNSQLPQHRRATFQQRLPPSLLRYSRSLVESLAADSSAFGGRARVEDLYGGNVIVVVNGTADVAEEEESLVYLLIKMHAGLWTLCVDLTGQNSWRELERGRGSLAEIN